MSTLTLYDGEEGEIRGKICPTCGGDLLQRKGKHWCDWCGKYVKGVRYTPIKPMELSAKDQRWLRENGMTYP